MMNYAQPLRAIGQALELLEIDGFYIEPHGNDFLVVREVPLAIRACEPVDENVVRHVWGLHPAQSLLEMGLGDLNRPAMKRLELRYSAEDVERLDLAGKAQRYNDRMITHRSRLSHHLRAVGHYLNRKHGRVVRISRCAAALAVEFRRGAAGKHQERFTFAELAEMSVQMCLPRAQQTFH